MMMNLFSIFDPSTSINFSFNWLSLMIIIFTLPYQFWLIPSRFNHIWMYFFNYMYNEFKILINYSKSNILIFASLMMFIFLNNFLGLFPYIFTPSSHMSFCLSMSLSLWLSMMIYNVMNYLNDFFSHLTPQGTPALLMPFMVTIESISLIIRPLTLSIRLTANMVAGHLLLSLLGSTSYPNWLILNIMIMTQILLYLLEISVSFIQAYVFSILSTLYSSEI